MKLTAVASGYFIVSVDGEEVSKHTTEREAIQSAVTAELARPESVVSYRHDYEVRVEAVGPPVITEEGDLIIRGAVLDALGLKLMKDLPP